MATKPSNELMAKRAAKMDDLAAGEDANSTKKQKIDEGDSDSSSNESIVSVGSMGSDDEWRKYKYWPEKEPEWDVDSYDGREFEINPRIRKIYSTQELYDVYYRDRLQAFQSKGFLLDPSHGIYEVYLDGPMRNFMADLANLCVKKFNETKGKTLELVNVLRATESGYAKRKLYITFMAREYQNGPLVEYQAKVIKFEGDVQPPFPILCRPSPKPET